MTDPTAFRRHGTAVVSDVLDLLGVAGQFWGTPRQSGTGTVAGPAYTVRFEAVTEGERAPAADFVDDVPSGSVVVIANDGRHCTTWGDILAAVAVRRGIAGTVIDGYCRDVDGIRETGYSVWARGSFMRSGKNRVCMVATQVPVSVGVDDDRITVYPGDLVVADGSGVVVVPGAMTAEVLARVEAVAEMERAVLRDVMAGDPLRTARATHGYNNVARRVPTETGA